MHEIKVYKSKWKAIKLMLLASPFVILSLSDILHYTQISPLWLDWVCLCFFGLCIPVGLFNLFDSRPELVLNQDGIFDRMSYGILNKNSNKGFVPWNSIQDAYLVTQQLRSPQGIPTSKQTFICLTLDKEEVLKLNNSPISRKLSKNLGLGDYTLPLINLSNFDEQKFMQLIKAMAHSNNIERQNLLDEFKP